MSYSRFLFTPRHEAGGELFLGEERVRRSERQGARHRWYCDQCGHAVRRHATCVSCAPPPPAPLLNLFQSEDDQP